MNFVSRWRWPLLAILGIAGSFLLLQLHVIAPLFEAQAVVSLLTPDARLMKQECALIAPTPILRQIALPFGIQARNIFLSARPQHPGQMKVTAYGLSPHIADLMAQNFAREWVNQSLRKHQEQVAFNLQDLQKRRTDVVNHLNYLLQQQKIVPRKQAFQLGYSTTEWRIHFDLLNAKVDELTTSQSQLRPLWKQEPALPQRRWPRRVEGWAWAVGCLVGFLLLGFLPFEKWAKTPSASTFHATPTDSAKMVWQVIAPSSAGGEALSISDDPRHRLAETLYQKWWELVRNLYEPAPAPPAGLLEQADRLLAETVEFLSTPDEALGHVLAGHVTPGDLPSHVTHTVLMTIIGAHEAGVESEHRQGLAWAALFHDLALVARSKKDFDEVGTEVGQLSAVLLDKIPGLPAVTRALVEKILIGMDEFSLSVWQQVAQDPNLEPLSKLLRRIDRFEKLMQKQKTRLERRLPPEREAI